MILKDAYMVHLEAENLQPKLSAQVDYLTSVLTEIKVACSLLFRFHCIQHFLHEWWRVFLGLIMLQTGICKTVLGVVLIACEKNCIG